MTGAREEGAAPGASFEEVDVLLFEVGERVYGVDAAQVIRIDRAESSSFTLPELGPLSHGRRGLVFEGEAEQAGQLRVDAVRGVRTVPVSDLRRIPPSAGAHAYTVGVLLADDQPILLIDLVEGLRFHGRQ